MKRYDVFDRWVDDNYVGDHASELADVLVSSYEAIRDILPRETSSIILYALREMDADAWEKAYGNGDKRLEETKGKEPAEFLRESLGTLEPVNFDFGAFAHCLYCYASAGIVEPANEQTSIDQQREWIAAQLSRGERIVSSIQKDSTRISFFRSIVEGARARWELDNNRPITVDQIARLSSLAGEKGNAYTGIFERTKKTIQNLVSQAANKAGAKGAIVLTKERLISAESAINWLRNESEENKDFFPSSWNQPDSDLEIGDEAADFILVPVTCAFSVYDAKPFTPSVRCDGGYEIGKGRLLFEDYWDALYHLSKMAKPRFRYPSVPASWGTLLCDEGWARIPRTQIEAELLEVAGYPLVADDETLRYVRQVENDARFRPYPKGHSEKVYRFETTTKRRPIAIEKRKGAPVIYISVDDAGHPNVDVPRARIIGASPASRNSNLNTIDAFKGKELIAFRPQSAEELSAVLDKVAK